MTHRCHGECVISGSSSFCCDTISTLFLSLDLSRAGGPVARARFLALRPVTDHAALVSCEKPQPAPRASPHVQTGDLAHRIDGDVCRARQHGLNRGRVKPPTAREGGEKGLEESEGRW